MSKKHYSNVDVASLLAKNGRGHAFKTQDEAELALAGDTSKLAAWGIIELLRRLNALGDSGKCDAEIEKIEKPENAKAFPEKKPGDFVYSGDLEDGISRYIVVSCDKSGFVLVVSCDAAIGDAAWAGQARVACDWHYSSERELVLESAASDIEFCTPRLERARKAIAACESGGDLMEFVSPSEEEQPSNGVR